MIKKLLTILAFFIIPTLGYAALVPTGWIRNTTTSKFYIPYLGDNVGIGTTSPYAKLSVVGPVVAEYFHATSTTATSTFVGGLNVGDGNLNYDFSSGETSIGSLLTGTQSFDIDAGMVQWTDIPISAAAAGTPQSYTAYLGGNPMLTIYGLAYGGTASTTLHNSVVVGTTTLSYAAFSVYGRSTGGATASTTAEFANAASTTLL